MVMLRRSCILVIYSSPEMFEDSVLQCLGFCLLVFRAYIKQGSTIT